MKTFFKRGRYPLGPEAVVRSFISYYRRALSVDKALPGAGAAVRYYADWLTLVQDKSPVSLKVPSILIKMGLTGVGPGVME
jgi:hypothetical protein